VSREGHDHGHRLGADGKGDVGSQHIAYPMGESDELWQLAQVVLHEGHVSSLNGGVGACCVMVMACSLTTFETL